MLDRTSTPGRAVRAALAAVMVLGLAGGSTPAAATSDECGPESVQVDSIGVPTAADAGSTGHGESGPGDEADDDECPPVAVGGADEVNPTAEAAPAPVEPAPEEAEPEADGDEATSQTDPLEPIAELMLLEGTAQLATPEETLAVLGAGQTPVDLEVTKAGVWSAERNEFTWSIVVRNIGSQTEAGTIVVNDILAAGLGAPVLAAPPGMTCGYDATTRQITCTTDVDLEPGAALAVTVVTARASTALCNVSNTVTVRGTGIETSSANNVATASLSDLCTDTATGPTTPTPGSGLPRTGSGFVLSALAVTLAAVGWAMTRLAAAVPNARPTS